MQEVSGSIPLGSTIFLKNFKNWRRCWRSFSSDFCTNQSEKQAGKV